METYLNILPSKRFDENFKEVVKPSKPIFKDRPQSNEDFHRERIDRGAGYLNATDDYNQAQQRKVLVPLSEFVKIWDRTPHNSFAVDVTNYTDYITQPITEKSLEGVECVMLKDGRCFTSKTFMMGYFYKTQTIEHAINDGVLFILKD